MEVTPGAPFLQRIAAYLRERFPLLGHGVLILSYYSSNQFLAKELLHPGEPMHFGASTILGSITLFCMFFHLRIFDEHKDFEDDKRLHPQRLLQQGLVSLYELRALGLVAIALEIALASIYGLPALSAVSIALLYSLLMLKEFFAKAWLKQRFLIYTASHMLIMPLFALVAFSFSTNHYPWQAPAWFWVYAFVGFFVTLNWEISRKIRAPEEEREGVQTYTKIFGTYGAAYLVLAVRAIDTALVCLVGYHLGLSSWFYAVLVLLFLVCMVGFLQFRFDTNPRTAKRMEFYAGIYIIAFDLTLAVEILRKNGMEWIG